MLRVSVYGELWETASGLSPAPCWRLWPREELITRGLMPHKQPTPDSQDLKHLASKREVFWQSHRLDKTALTDRAIWCLTVCGGRGGGGAGTAFFFFFPFSLEMQGSSSEYNYPHRTCPGSPILSLTQDTELSRWGPRLEGLLWEVTRLRDVLISPWETNLDTSITWGGNASYRP